MKILFICTGNASRSPLAEVVLRKMLSEAGIADVEVLSCGTETYRELARNEFMCRIAAEHSYVMGGNAVPMTEELLNSADLIIVMTVQQRNEVTRMLKYAHWNRIFRFNDYCFAEATDLPDPYFQPESVYRETFDTIERGCKEIIKKLQDFPGRKLY
ncbi:MAG: low molecular weight phosphotyrosine protein phosphatase [Bacteroidaceae bacterium]|nr:low molecular weight phosphotyrosine protein phosphatase [Bacteroidaceae bacterium]